jgi:hypothetical protein
VGGAAMKDILQWIPNFLKGMLEVLEKVQEMSGGKVRGHIIFWGAIILSFAFATLFLMNWSNSAYTNFCAFLTHFNIHIEQVEIGIPSSIFPKLLLTFLVALIEMVLLIAFAGTIGAFIGMITSVLFPAFTTYRVDMLFKKLIPLLKQADEINHSIEIARILDEANILSERWQKRWSNKATRFLTTKANKKKFENMEL